MAKIIDADEVQRELNRAARDAKVGPRDVRAGRFVHANARGDRTARANAPGTAPHSSKAGPQRNSKPVR